MPRTMLRIFPGSGLTRRFARMEWPSPGKAESVSEGSVADAA
jgi:hypothetical protein